MEKDLGKIKKNNDSDIIVRIDDFGGRLGLTIREYVNSSPSGYKGFTKAGTRIPLESLEDFKKMISSLDIEELKKQSGAIAKPEQKQMEESEESYL